MLYWMMPTGLQYVIEAEDIALDVGVRVLDAVAHTCLGGEVHYDVEVVLLEEAVDEGLVSKVTLDELIIDS